MTTLTRLKTSAVTLMCLGSLGQVATAQVRQADPYQLRFEDFPWTEPIGLKQLEGAQPLGERLPTAQAIAKFERRLVDDPQDVAALTLLGELYLQLAKEEDDLPAYDQSEKLLRQALELMPESLAARLHLAQTLLAKHRFAEACDLAKAALRTSPTSAVGQAVLFDALLELGDYAAADTALQKLLELERSPPVLARKARLAELKGETDEALSLLTECVAAEPNSVWYAWRLGGLRFNSGHTQQALAAYQQALRLDSHDGSSQVDMAVCQFAVGNVDAAKRLLSEAVAEQNEPPMLSLLGDFYAATGDSRQAEQWYQKTEQAMAEEAKIAGDAHAREVAMFLADHDRDLPRALELAQRDLRMRQDIFAYDTLAWIHFKLGNHEAAAAAIGKALSLGSRAPQLIYHAACIAECLDQRPPNLETPEHYWQILRETNPGFSILHAKYVKTKL